MGYLCALIIIKIVVLFLFLMARAYSAEAFHSGATERDIRLPLPLQTRKAIIIAPGRNYHINGSQADRFTGIGDSIRARFTVAIAEARQTVPPENTIDIGAHFAENFTAAARFSLIPRYPSPDIVADSITLSRGDAAAFLSLPQADERLLASHFIQPLFGTDYVIWPHHQISPIEMLSYRAPLTAMVRYGEAQIARPFTGQIILSFDQFEGQISLSAQQEAFDLFFRIDDWHKGAPLQLDALLRQGADDYPASLLLAYTGLPHSAIWGYFRNHHSVPTAPQDGHFTNFTLPEN